MSSSLLALLSQQQPPTLQTRKALIVTGLQNEFMTPEGKLPINTPPGYFDRLRELISSFREFGDVVWIKSEFEASREINVDEGDSIILGPVRESRTGLEEGDEYDSPLSIENALVSSIDDPPSDTTSAAEGTVGAEGPILELQTMHVDDDAFLTQTSGKEACCLPGSPGAEFCTQAKDIMDLTLDRDLTKTHYSAFQSTSLLLILRSRLVTDLFLCGGATNISTYATAMDAARYGLKITLVEDCLAARHKVRHDLAIQRLREIMDADVMKGGEVIDILRNPRDLSENDSDEYDSDEEYGNLEPVVLEGNTDAGLQPLEAASDEEDDDEDLHALLNDGRPMSSRLQDLVASSRFASTRNRHSLQSTARKEEALVPAEPTTIPDPPAEDIADVPLRGLRGGSDSDLQSGGGSGEKHTQLDLDESSNDRRPRFNESHDGGVVEDQVENDRSSNGSALSNSPKPTSVVTPAIADQETIGKPADMLEEMPQDTSPIHKREATAQPLFGEGKETEALGSKMYYDLLPEELAETIFDELSGEIDWQTMHHQTGEVPRLVCCQGSINEAGDMPVYRHPADHTLPIQSWTPTVDKVRKAAEVAVGHRLNHALIQLYRGGTDYISEHSDKTLDIVKDSFIVNVSFGAQRTMRLRTKRGALTPSELVSSARTTYRVPMPHNSMITMALATNANFLHGINADKRLFFELSETEKAYGSQRISITFRNIGTFLNSDSSRIWGQGATSKDKEHANAVISGDPNESAKLIQAFGTENMASTIQWDTTYGHGFDVLHIK